MSMNVNTITYEYGIPVMTWAGIDATDFNPLESRLVGKIGIWENFQAPSVVFPLTLPATSLTNFLLTVRLTQAAVDMVALTSVENTTVDRRKNE